MLRNFKILTVQLLCLAAFSQTDGAIVERIELKNFDQLLTYIQNTEARARDSIKLDASRFAYFDQVDVQGITYWSDSLRVKGFLLQPKKAGKYPAIIYNRGGSLDFGTLTHYVSSIGLGELARLAHGGYVIAASQYRGNGGSEGQEEYGGRDINDVLNLIPLLAAEPKADTTRLGMFGWSRGSMTSFLTLKRTDKFKAMAIGGPSTDISRTAIDDPELDEWWSEFIPNYNVNKKAVLERRSPIYWVHELPKTVPILILQGENDGSIPPEYTLDFAKELSKHKVPYKLVKFVNGTHSLKEVRDEYFGELFAWFGRYLK
ncbi:alpha/beta hydrolase family protein [Flagellimonas myxillae]|uniref:alpha/beta hydrolase family protein n=1 Tax=Flagellimonas myxillae TaxID=2942214 RepID=UPI00201F4003|nr:prolyl oligopeptidase family serine peptidase [Muricauda myxillae]MCL6265954.1 prolyl oligopeptidase family serine peptidase [Muricauda myxillae]